MADLAVACIPAMTNAGVRKSARFANPWGHFTLPHVATNSHAGLFPNILTIYLYAKNHFAGPPMYVCVNVKVVVDGRAPPTHTRFTSGSLELPAGHRANERFSHTVFPLIRINGRSWSVVLTYEIKPIFAFLSRIIRILMCYREFF